jgi:hypothetical protein
LSDKTPSLKDLTKLGVFFGRIPETHIENLKAFPFIYFNKLTEAKLDYSVETIDKTKSTLFCYDLTLDLDENNFLDKRYKALEDAVRLLFWKDIKIIIRINDEEVYKSE